jgi:DNA-binding CsgD family transcriptional regulator
VNEQRIDESAVAAGDSLRFGAVRFWVFSGPWRLRSSIAEREPSTTSMRPDGSAANTTVLSAAQLRVLDFLLRGNTERDIAQQLYISPHTVHSHLREIYARFAVHSRTQLFVRILGGTTNADSPGQSGPSD